MHKGSYIFVALSLLPAGCQIYVPFARNMCILPKQFFDECHASGRNKRLAKIALAEFEQHQQQQVSKDFASGFMTGFADYLDAGGNGEPPVAPPPHYQTVQYQTPQGRQAVEDWFAGFRQGALMAQASGLRELVTVPVSGAVEPRRVATSPQATPPAANEPVLPPPRTLPPAQGPGARHFNEPTPTMPAPPALPPPPEWPIHTMEALETPGAPVRAPSSDEGGLGPFRVLPIVLPTRAEDIRRSRTATESTNWRPSPQP